MKKKWIPHIIAVLTFLVFIVLGLASATGPSVGGSTDVYYNANGGIGTIIRSQTVKKGESITIQGGEGLSFGDATFDGWFGYSYPGGNLTNYRGGESIIPPGGYITLYAKWKLDGIDFESAKGFANKMAWLQNNAVSGGNYTIELNADESFGSQPLIFPGKSNITITLRGVGSNRVISSAVKDNLSAVPNSFVLKNSLFIVPPGVTLVLDNNITLLGNSDNNDFLIITYGTGTLRMNKGSVIIGNGGGGVMTGGNFEMSGGTISGNKEHSYASGSYNLKDFLGNNDEKNFDWGRGVAVGGTFTMNGGEISDNNYGGGVFIWNNGTFTMNSGAITNNTLNGNITQVYGNQKVTSSRGGGVHIWNDGTFTMNGGTISGNRGSGVVVDGKGTLTINNGTISRNTAYGDNRGGGVYLWNNAIFRRTGGTVSGNTPDDIYPYTQR